MIELHISYAAEHWIPKPMFHCSTTVVSTQETDTDRCKDAFPIMDCLYCYCAYIMIYVSPLVHLRSINYYYYYDPTESCYTVERKVFSGEIIQFHVKHIQFVESTFILPMWPQGFGSVMVYTCYIHMVSMDQISQWHCVPTSWIHGTRDVKYIKQVLSCQPARF